MTRLFAGATYSFIGNRTRAFAASGALLLAGIVGVLLNVITVGDWQRHGVEFTGGALVELRVDGSFTEERVRSAAAGLGPVEVNALGDGQTLLLRLPLGEEDVNELRARVQERLAADAGGGTAQVLSVEPLGAQAGAAALGTTAFAVLLALALSATYLAVRVGVPPGAAAALATLHDLVILLGLVALLRVVVDPAVIAAAIAVVAWSLKDKTVVLDRIREHRSRKSRGKPDPASLIDRALNETLPRSALTSAATLLFVLALAIVGPATFRGFWLVLAVGILLATYSSLFILGPLVLELGRSEGPDRKKRTRPQTAAV